MEVKTEKTCLHCGAIAPSAEFQKGSLKCRQCRKEYHRLWYIKNKDKCAVKARAKRELDPVATAAKDVAYRLRYRDRILATKRRQSVIHSSTNVARAAAWVKANPDRARECSRISAAARRATRRGNGGVFTKQQWLDKLNYYNYHCAYCLSESPFLTIDHIVPIARGGRHADENIAPACGSCNSRKAARTPLEFIASISVPRSALRVASVWDTKK